LSIVAESEVGSGREGGLNIIEPIYMTGGVCQATSVVAAMEKALGKRIKAPKDPQLIGALGTAIIASEDSD
jgi:activator of 2-hydroxyglutaryl-CoA dehydratase